MPKPVLPTPISGPRFTAWWPWLLLAPLLLAPGRDGLASQVDAVPPRGHLIEAPPHLRARHEAPAPPGPWRSVPGPFRAGGPPVPRQPHPAPVAGASRDLTWESIGPEGGYIWELAVDPGNPDIIYAVPLASPENRLFRSTDGGDSWSLVGPIAGSINALAVDPVSPSTLYAGGWHYCHKSTDGGLTWTSFSLPGTYSNLQDICVDFGQPSVLHGCGYYYTGSGYLPVAFRSADAGTTWTYTSLKPGADFGYGQAIGMASSQSDTVYAAGYYSTLSSYYASVFRSVDGGGSWTEVQSGITGAFGYELAVDPFNSNKVFFAGTGGTFLTTNGGASWSRPIGVASYSVAVCPSDPEIVYAGGYDILYHSYDGGQIWHPCLLGVLGHQVFELVISPDPGHPAVAGSQQGILKSPGGGCSWDPSNSGLDAAHISHFGLSPDDPDVVYASLQYVSVYRSDDRGFTWTELPDFTGCGSVTDLAVSPSDIDLIYAFSGG